MSSNLVIGQTVFVDFEACNRTAADGKVFSGHGVIDRLEDGYCFGKTDDGRPFCCPTAFVFPPNDNYKTPSDLDLFKTYIKSSDDYQSLMNVHGERLFNCENGSFHVLSIRLAYKIWCQQREKQSITGRELNRFNIILGLLLAVLVMNYCNDFGVPEAAPFVVTILVLALVLWMMVILIKSGMSKNINE